MTIDGKSLWDSKITKDMIKWRASPSKSIETFPELPADFYEALKRTAAVYPNKTALVDDDGSRCTYRQLLAQSGEFAAYLYRKRKVRGGTHVGILLYNSVAFAVSFLALSRLGAVAVLLPGKFKQAELLPLVGKAEVELLICDADYTEWFEGTGAVKDILSIGKGKDGSKTGWRFPEQSCRKEEQVLPEEISPGRPENDAMLLFTSGTTSQSKGVLLKNYNLMHAVEAYRRTLHITERDISVIATPIYHITGLVALLGLFIYVGGTLYLHRIFDAKRVVEEARKYGFTFLHASPTVFNLIIQEGEHTPEIPSLVSFACGSSNMAKEKLLRLHKWLPRAQFHTVYGLTETSSPAAIFPGDAASSRHIGSSGLPIPGTKFRIIDEEGRALPSGEVGEIAVSGSVVTEGYYKQEAASLKGGWLYTGDLGYFNEAGYLYVVDRKKNMINRGGEKIWCYDVENEISCIEGVLDAAVVGIPDELYGEVAAAVVQPAEGSCLTEKEIQQYLRGRIAKYKIPVKIKMVDSVPETKNGKTDKITIRRMLMEDEI